MRWKTLAVAAATFGLLGGVALADDQPIPQTNQPQMDQKVDPQQNSLDQKTPAPSDDSNQLKGGAGGDVGKPGGDVGKQGGDPGKQGGDLDKQGGDVGKQGGDVGKQGSDVGKQGGGGEGMGSPQGGGDTQGTTPPSGGNVGQDAAPSKGQHGAIGQAGKVDRTHVREVQQKLKDQSIYMGEVDGVVGPQTRKAIRQFQQSKGLKVSGQLDSATLSAMGISMEGGTAPSP